MKTRREFVKTVVAGTTGLTIGSLGFGSKALANFVEEDSGMVPPPVFAPTEAEVTEALSRALLTFRVRAQVGGNGTLGMAVNGNSDTHTPIIVALAAYAGDKRLYNGDGFSNQTATQRTIAQLRHWADPSEQNAPGGLGGYQAQYEMCFVATVAIARLTPAVWGALTAEEINRLDLCMKGCMVANCFVISDNVPYMTDWGGPGMSTGRRTPRGYSAGRFVAPNYSTPAKLIPHVVAFYMGADGTNGPSAAQAWLNNFDRTTFANQVLAAGGLKDLYETYCQTWTRAVQDRAHPAYDHISAGGGPTGDGPTEKELKAALMGGGTGVFKGLDRTLDMATETLDAEIRNFFSRPIVPGVTGLSPGDDTPLSGAETSGVPGDTVRRGVKGDFTRGVLRAVIMNKSDWAGLPNQGEPHMANELWARDGGFVVGPSSLGGPKVRSAMSYCHLGLTALMAGAISLAVQGAISRTDPKILATREKLAKGITDLQYRDKVGYRSYAKGGNPAGYSNTNNEDWDAGFIERNNLKVITRYAMHRMYDAWLGDLAKMP